MYMYYYEVTKYECVQRTQEQITGTPARMVRFNDRIRSMDDTLSSLAGRLALVESRTRDLERGQSAGGGPGPDMNDPGRRVEQRPDPARPDEDKTVCVICQSEMTEKNSCTLLCGHLLHLHCYTSMVLNTVFEKLVMNEKLYPALYKCPLCSKHVVHGQDLESMLRGLATYNQLMERRAFNAKYPDFPHPAGVRGPRMPGYGPVPGPGHGGPGGGPGRGPCPGPGPCWYVPPNIHPNNPGGHQNLGPSGNVSVDPPPPPAPELRPRASPRTPPPHDPPE